MQAYFYIPLLIEIAVIMIVYAFFVRKHTSYGKKWYAFMKWFETRDDTCLISYGNNAMQRI